MKEDTQIKILEEVYVELLADTQKYATFAAKLTNPPIEIIRVIQMLKRTGKDLMQWCEKMNRNVEPAPKLEELLTKDGDLVFRQAYHSETTVIRKAEIEVLLEGEELNDATVWEVIAKWNRRYSTPSDTQHLPA